MTDGFLESDFILRNRYSIIEPIKPGTMGTIYLARDMLRNKLVAIKELSINTSISGEELVVDFRREAQILSTLQHPNLPEVLDYFNEEKGYYLVMDYIEGNDLETIIEESFGQGIPERKVLSWALSICSILEYLHTQSPPVIYGDLKPSNILLRDSDSKIFLVDFGLARVLSKIHGRLSPIGTEGYSPPEQYKGEQDTRSDIYSLGATIYHLLTAVAPSVPFEFTSLKSMNPRISNEMDFILSKALKKEPQSRYQKVSEFRDNLTAIYTKYYGHDTTALLPGDEKSLQERNKIKIFLVDDDQVMRLLFKSIIKRTNDMELIGEASNGKSAIDLSKNLSPRPDVILMDINMPGLDGIETTRSILQLNPEARIIMLTALSETKVVRRAFIAGAKGYMLKGGSIKSVTEAIRKAYRGGLAIDNRISNIIEKKITKSTFKKPVFEMGSVIRLQNYSFITIMIHFSSNRATGKMLLKNSKETGEIWFKEGNIIHAVLGKLKGENAVYSFLCWEGVEVTFTMHTMPPEETIKIKKDKFITRSLRKNREMAKLRLTISSPYEIPVLNSLQEYQIVSLYDEERNLLNFIDGSKSIMEIAQDMEVSYFDIIKYVYRMVSMGLILITNRVST